MDKNNPKPHLKLALSLIIVPGLLAVSSLIILICINLIFNPTFWMTPDTAPVNPTPHFITALNGVFIAIGGISLLSLLPCIAIGAYLLFLKQKRSV